MDWKSFSVSDIALLKSDPENYFRAIVQFSQWDLLSQELHSTDLSRFALRALRTKKCRKSFLNGKTAEEIVNLMDGARDPIRRRLLKICILKYDDTETVAAVGKELLDNMPQHAWAHNFLKEVYSIQSTEDLRKVFCARIKGEELKHGLTPELWKSLLKDEHNYAKKTFKETEGITLCHFCNLKLLNSRQSFGNLITELAAKAISSYQKKEVGYKKYVILPFMSNFMAMEKIWRKHKTMREQIRQAILDSNPGLFRKVYTALLIDNSASNTLNLQRLLRAKVLFPADMLERVIPTIFQHEVDGSSQSKILETLTRSVIRNECPPGSLVRHMKALSREEPSHPLGKFWPIMVGKIEGLVSDDLRDGGKMGLFKALVQQLEFMDRTCQDAWQSSPYSILLSYDEVMGMLTNIIQHVFETKGQIVKESPLMYTRMMNTILRSLTSIDRFGTDNFVKLATGSMFFFLPVELRDKIVMETMRDPLGVKELNEELSKQSSTVALAMSLLITDLGRMAEAIDSTRAKKCDSLGFRVDMSLSFPPLLSSQSRASRTYKGTVHLYEKFLYHSLRHKDSATQVRAFELYHSFLMKVLETAKRVDDPSLYQNAAEMHYRFCTYCISKVASTSQGTLLSLFASTVCHPLAVYAYVKAGGDAAVRIKDNLLVVCPYGHRQCKMLLVRILRNMLVGSYSELLPGIGQTMGEIAAYLINRVFAELPASFNMLAEPIDFMSFSHELTKPNRPEVVKKTMNSLASLTWPEKYRKKVMARMFVRGVEPCQGVFVDPELYSPENEKVFEPEQIYAGPEPVLEVLKFVKARIDEYQPAHFMHPTTKFIKESIEILKDLFNNRLPVVRKTFPSVSPGYEKNHIHAEYSYVCQQNSQFTVVFRRETALMAKNFLPNWHLCHSLLCIDSVENVFDLLDGVINYVPLSVEQARNLEGKPKPKIFYSKAIPLMFSQNKSNIMRILSVELQPKPKRYERGSAQAGRKLPDPPPKKWSQKYYEPWLLETRKSLFAPVLQCDPVSDICERMRLEGPTLVEIVVTLRQKQVKGLCNKQLISFVLSVMDLLVKDLQIKNPKKTPGSAKPKETPSLFCDEYGVIRGSVPAIRGGYTRQKMEDMSAGLAKFVSTRKLMAHVSYMLTFICQNEVIDLEDVGRQWSSVVDGMLSMSPSEMKRIIGDLNEDHWADYFVQTCLELVPWGNEVRSIDWAKTTDQSIFATVFKLLSADQFHYIVLDLLSAKILSMSSMKERWAVISTLISALSTLKNQFTLRTRRTVVAWCLDGNYVGYPLPDFCIEYVIKVSQTEKLHVDVKRAIAAGIISYFKNQYVRCSELTQVEALFAILEGLYKSSKLELIPTFCQLVRPKFCRELAESSNTYREMMPEKARPDMFVAPQHFGELSMPRKGVWSVPYEKYISLFISSSLLCKDENTVQLVVQVLAKIGVRGGNVSKEITPFITRACNEFNPSVPSPNLLNFMFRFCSMPEHQDEKAMIEAFMGVFAKARSHLNSVNSKQMKSLWLHEDRYQANAYDECSTFYNTCIQCFATLAGKTKERQDMKGLNCIAKMLYQNLQSAEPLLLQFEPADILHFHARILSDDNFMKAYMEKEPCEKSLECLLAFLKGMASELNIWRFSLPDYVHEEFRRNERSMTKRLLLELRDWPDALAGQATVHQLLQAPIENALREFEKSSKELDEVLPSLWRFRSVVLYRTCTECLDTGKGQPKRFAPLFAKSVNCSAVKAVRGAFPSLPPPPPPPAGAAYGCAMPQMAKAGAKSFVQQEEGYTGDDVDMDECTCEVADYQISKDECKETERSIRASAEEERENLSDFSDSYCLGSDSDSDPGLSGSGSDSDPGSDVECENDVSDED